MFLSETIQNPALGASSGSGVAVRPSRSKEDKSPPLSPGTSPGTATFAGDGVVPGPVETIGPTLEEVRLAAVARKCLF